MSTLLEFVVDGQRLVRSDRWELVANQTVNYVKAHFIFLSDEWVPEQTTVVFESPEHEIYTVQLDSDGYCDVPNEVIFSHGYVVTSLFYSVVDKVEKDGELVDTITFRITTNPVKIYTFETLTTLLGGDS